MGYTTVTVDRENYVGTITLNRPEQLNTFSPEMTRILNQALIQLKEVTEALANKLAEKSPLTLKMGKQAFCGMSEMEFGKALEYTNETFAALCVTDDAREGVDAFLKKRKPVWKEKQVHLSR